MLSELTEHEKNLVETLLEWGRYSSIEEAVKNRNKYFLDEEIKSEKDLACRYLKEYHPELDSFIKKFINLNALGRELSKEGFINEYGYTTPKGVI